MHDPVSKLIHWTPRILGIVLFFFLALFALDVFEEKYSFTDLTIAFFMHLIPAFCVLLVLVVSWRWQRSGALIFLALAIFYPLWTAFKFHISAYFAISGPLAIIAGLLYLDWKINFSENKKSE